MATTPFELTELDDDAQWDRLVDSSPQGTVFSQSGFLRSLGCRFRRYRIGTPSRTMALCSAIEDSSGEKLQTFAFTPYQGLLFLPDAAVLPRQRLLDEFRITEFVIKSLTERYRSVAMTLSWNFSDLRPFLWHNYHDADRGQFRSSPRYTAVLDLRSLDEQAYPNQTRACRRQELRKAGAYRVQEEHDVEHFLTLYGLTFARQGITLPEATLGLVRRICQSALAQGYGRISSCCTPQGVASMMLVLFDRQRAYYMFAANDPEFRSTGAATRLMFEAIFFAKQRGVFEFDFVGVNSPNRGDFKLSFNPELKLYFDLRYDRGVESTP